MRFTPSYLSTTSEDGKEGVYHKYTYKDTIIIYDSTLLTLRQRRKIGRRVITQISAKRYSQYLRFTPSYLTRTDRVTQSAWHLTPMLNDFPLSAHFCVTQACCQQRSEQAACQKLTAVTLHTPLFESLEISKARFPMNQNSRSLHTASFGCLVSAFILENPSRSDIDN